MASFAFMNPKRAEQVWQSGRYLQKTTEEIAKSIGVSLLNKLEDDKSKELVMLNSKTAGLRVRYGSQMVYSLEISDVSGISDAKEQAIRYAKNLIEGKASKDELKLIEDHVSKVRAKLKAARDKRMTGRSKAA